MSKRITDGTPNPNKGSKNRPTTATRTKVQRRQDGPLSSSKKKWYSATTDLRG